MEYFEMSVSVGDSTSRSCRGFEFRDQEELDYRKSRYLAENPEHASKYEGAGTIIFPGEWSPSNDYNSPSLPGAY